MNTNTELLDLLNDEPVFPENETGVRRQLDYLGWAPCPIRTELRQRLHRHFLAASRSGGPEPVWFMPAGCHSSNVYDDLWRTTNAADLPGLISETGFGDFNRPEFVSRWHDKGVFARIPDDDVRPEFREAGLVDPRGLHRVYGANPEVVLVDLKRLGNRPLPRSWADILNPRFKRDVVISGEPGDIHESLLFGLYRDHGEAGLAALGANVRDFMHPAEMAKTAGSQSPRGAALYVLPGFFARSGPHRTATQIVWPDEGAYLTPLYVMRKCDARPASALVLDYLCGAEWSAHLAKVGLAPARAGSLPLPGKLRWVGWDFVRENDIEVLRAPLNAAFVRGYDG